MQHEFEVGDRVVIDTKQKLAVWDGLIGTIIEDQQAGNYLLTFEKYIPGMSRTILGHPCAWVHERYLSAVELSNGCRACGQLFEYATPRENFICWACANHA